MAEKLTRAAALSKLQNMAEQQKSEKSRDPSDRHEEADAILCALLRQEGMNDIVDIYESLEKWYE